MSTPDASVNSPASSRPDDLERLPTIDVRALAVMRIGLALVILFDVGVRLSGLGAHYTDHGVLPRAALVAYFSGGDLLASSASPFMWSGDAWLPGALLTLLGIAAACLLVGWRTWHATVACWVLVLLVQTRNPLINDGGDLLLRCLLFWAMFLPWGALVSLDSRTPGSRLPSPSVISGGSLAWLLQVCFMYWFAVLLRSHPMWTTERTAVYYALNLDIFTSPLGRGLLAYPALLSFLTTTVYFLEYFGPIAAFIPWKNAWWRTIVVVVFWGLHAGLALVLNLYAFQATVILAWVAFLPKGIWDRIWPLRLPEAAPTPVDAHVSAPGRWGLPDLLAIVLLVFVTLWNVREILPEQWKQRILPAQLNSLGYATGLNQRWGLFAPYPLVDDGWYVLRGTLADGSVVNLWDHSRTLPLEKPNSVRTLYGNRHWQKYLINLWSAEYHIHRPAFADWLVQHWNAAQARDLEGKKVILVEMIFMKETTPPPSQPLPVPQAIVLGKWRYDSQGERLGEELTWAFPSVPE